MSLGTVEAEEIEHLLQRPILGPTRQTLQLKEFRAFSVLQTRLQLFLTDELIARLRVIFENEFLFRVGVHWGDNPLCGALYSAMYKRSLVECKFPEASKALLQEGKLRSLFIPDLFVLVLQVSTNRYRRIDGQPASVTAFGGQKPAPLGKLFRIAGTVERNNTYDVSATRKPIRPPPPFSHDAGPDSRSRCAGPWRSCAPSATSTSSGSACTTPRLSQTATSASTRGPPPPPQPHPHRISAHCPPRPRRRARAPRPHPAGSYLTRQPGPGPAPEPRSESSRARKPPPSQPRARDQRRRRRRRRRRSRREPKGGHARMNI
jgi:hypothetical protein